MNRIRIHTWLPFCLLAALLASCSRGYRVEGNSSIISLDGKMLYVKMLKDGAWVAVDSAEVIHGSFRMKGAVDSVRMVRLYMNDDALMPFVLENGRVRVSITPGSFVAGGTPLNDRLYEFIGRRNDLQRAVDDLERQEARMVLDGADIDDIHDELKRQAEAKLREMDEYTRQFIVDNYENVLGPSVFLMMCSTLPYPVMTEQVEDVVRTAPQAFKEHPLVRDFLLKARENMRLMEEHKRLQENMAANVR